MMGKCTQMNVTFSQKKKIDFKAEPLMLLDLSSHMKSLYFTLKQYLHKVERTVPSLVSILKLFANGHFLKAVIDRASVLPLLIFSSGSQSKRKNQVPRKYYMINMKNICLSPSKKTFTFCKQSFFLSAENNCSIIYEGE